jgi:hypothetical protein
MCNFPTHYVYPSYPTHYVYPYPWAGIIPPSCPCCGRCPACGQRVNTGPSITVTWEHPPVIYTANVSLPVMFEETPSEE